MLLKQILESISQQNTLEDSSAQSLDKWHNHDSDFPFLRDARYGNLPVLVLSEPLILHSTIIPKRKLHGDYVAELLEWNFGPSEGYGYGWSYSKGRRSYYLSEPMEYTGTEILDGTTPIIFDRYFPGYGDKSGYWEINQRISHVLDLHWVEKKDAWCYWNDLGEVVPTVQLVEENDITCCTFDRDKLDTFLFLSKSVLVQVFEFGRYLEAGFPGPVSERTDFRDEKHEIYAVKTTYGSGQDRMSFMRGFQIIRCEKSNAQMRKILDGRNNERYVEFTIFDWKHSRIVEWSCDPAKLGNYFVPSDLPFQISPAFFKPEVLAQYQQDPSRYTIKDRRIECKKAWSLRYDINDEGQIFVYINDFNKVPYEVQLHWRAYNETPKAGISHRAFMIDFKGEFFDLDDPLSKLKDLLTHFPVLSDQGEVYEIWRLPKLSETRNLETLQYVVTKSRKEWEDQILTLSHILVEGLNKKPLSKLAEALGCLDETLGSIKQLRRILETTGLPSSEVDEIVVPLQDIWKLRSSGIAHPGNASADEEYDTHFKRLVSDCYRAMQMLATLITAGNFSDHETD